MEANTALRPAGKIAASTIALQPIAKIQQVLLEALVSEVDFFAVLLLGPLTKAVSL